MAHDDDHDANSSWHHRHQKQQLYMRKKHLNEGRNENQFHDWHGQNGNSEWLLVGLYDTTSTQHTAQVYDTHTHEEKEIKFLLCHTFNV